MTTLAADTAPEIEELQIRHLRAMPAWRKLALVGQMTLAVRQLALTGLRQRYPQDTPTQHQRRLAELLLGPELAALAYGPSPEGQ
jgi:hypothetical protein